METELETRLRGYASQYDRDFPSTTGVERRIIARIAITPLRPARPAIRRWEWGTAGGLVRELAIVAAVLLLASVLVVGATKLRSLQTRTVTPPVESSPPVAKPVQPPAYWTAAVPGLLGSLFAALTTALSDAVRMFEWRPTPHTAAPVSPAASM